MGNIKQRELLKEALREIVIQAHLGDPKAQKIIEDIENLVKESKKNSQSAANTPATVGK